jgi:hypothetical protein
MKTKPTFIIFAAVFALLCVAAAVRQTSAIHIVNDTDEIQLKINTSTQTAPLVEIATSGTTKFSLPATGIVPVTYGGTGAASVSAAKTALGIQSGSITNAADGTVTNTFATAFSSAPVVIGVQTGNGTTTTNTFTITASNFVWNAGAPSKVLSWVAIGAP